MEMGIHAAAREKLMPITRVSHVCQQGEHCSSDAQQLGCLSKPAAFLACSYTSYPCNVSVRVAVRKNHLACHWKPRFTLAHPRSVRCTQWPNPCHKSQRMQSYRIRGKRLGKAMHPGRHNDKFLDVRKFKNHAPMRKHLSLFGIVRRAVRLSRVSTRSNVLSRC